MKNARFYENYVFNFFFHSSKLRTRFNQFENYRSNIKDDPKRPEHVAKLRKITVLQPGIHVYSMWWH